LSHDVRVVAAIGVMSKNDRAAGHDHANHLEDGRSSQRSSLHDDLLNAAIGQRNALSPAEDVTWDGNALVRPERFQRSRIEVPSILVASFPANVE
tara:strand:+ start:7047 stop:7331 length:285 start_codon:yes stop_codon:yes gene_type:complete